VLEIGPVSWSTKGGGPGVRGYNVISDIRVKGEKQ
jgi:hypothetical protein